MGLTAQDLLAPKGDLESSLFPGESASLRLEQYLAEGYAKAGDVEDPDGAARAWAYHRAYRARYLALISSPTQQDFGNGQGSASISAAQLQMLQDQADQWLLTFEALVPAVEPTTAPQAEAGPVRTEIVW